VLVVDDAHARPSAVSWGYWSAGRTVDEAIADLQTGTDRRRRVVPAASAGRYRCHVVRRSTCKVVAGCCRCPTFEIRPGRVEQMATTSTAPPSRSTATRSAGGSSTAYHAARDRAGGRRLAFTGWQVRSAFIFDPAAPVLFDFRIRQAGLAVRVRTARRAGRALVDDRVCAPDWAATGADGRAALGRYLSN
jgi:hypothetical protein